MWQDNWIFKSHPLFGEVIQLRSLSSSVSQGKSVIFRCGSWLSGLFQNVKFSQYYVYSRIAYRNRFIFHSVQLHSCNSLIPVSICHPSHTHLCWRKCFLLWQTITRLYHTHSMRQLLLRDIAWSLCWAHWWDDVYAVDSSGPEEPCIGWVTWSPHEKGHFWGTVRHACSGYT